jgi:nucleoid DNA-binding protein
MNKGKLVNAIASKANVALKKLVLQNGFEAIAAEGKLTLIDFSRFEKRDKKKEKGVI